MKSSKRTGWLIASALVGIIAVGCAPQEPTVVVEPGKTQVVHDRAPGTTIINHPATPPVIVVPPATKGSDTKTDTTTTTNNPPDGSSSSSTTTTKSSSTGG